MILILSDENDASTNDVIDWLLHSKIPYFRINETSSVHVDYLTANNGKIDFRLSIASQYTSTPFSIFADEIKGYWYRRGFVILQMPEISETNSTELNIVVEKFNKYIVAENMKIVDFFYNFFSTIPHLGCFKDNLTINKIYNLSQAQKVNILIPDFLLTRNKSDIELFLKEHTCCISKGIDQNGFHIHRKISLGNFAKLLTASDLARIPTQFNYSFIQQYIDKKADIRIFYIDGKIYSTAIFSQNDEQTRVDFRNYNDKKPNRIQPFKLPKEEEKKLKKLMKALNYQTGSIDYLLDKNNLLYFLEINPVGQYGFISNKCNLFLNKAICDYFKTNYYGKN